ncbi:MAG: hypothetical protein M3Y54_07415 [Bacteroidota bacterium]|nr:hypothetical protein [Bacteroidota bacterium]
MKSLFSILFLAVMTVFFWSCNEHRESTAGTATAGSDRIQPTHKPTDSLSSTVLHLLDASAKDFHEHQPPVPVRFRDVQFKYFRGNNYLICGEFLAQAKQDKQEWTPFATIKTSGYEQWIGLNALPYCQDSKAIPYQGADLSSALKSRFDGLQNVPR